MKAKQKSRPVGDELISRHKLDKWIEDKLNVLFKGKHGVGKTSLILKAFKRAGLRYAYFSGATMDPFIDFIGVPIKAHNPKTGKDYITLLRPKHIEDLDVQAIFFDEFNRTHKKIRNAVMELLQFKTINGQPLSSDLRIVWAAINPDDDEGEYDVEHLDPAQQDRFHVQVNIPFKCSLSYFRKKYGDKGETAVMYWNKLPKEIQDKVSPRRLDYTLKMFFKKGDIRDVLPVEANPSKLLLLLSGKGYKDLNKLVGNYGAAEEFFRDETNYALYIQDVLTHGKYHVLFDALPSEKIIALLAGKDSQKIIQKHIRFTISKNKGTFFRLYRPILEECVKANTNTRLAFWSKTTLLRFKLFNKMHKKPVQSSSVKTSFTGKSSLAALAYIFGRNTNVTFSPYRLQKELQSLLGKTFRESTIVHKLNTHIPTIERRFKVKIKALKNNTWICR